MQLKTALDLLGQGQMHSSFVWKESPKKGFKKGERVGLVHELLLLTTDPPHGFSQSDH